MVNKVHDTPHNLRTEWPEIIDMGELFNSFIAQNNLEVDVVWTFDNISGGMEIVSHDQAIINECI